MIELWLVDLEAAGPALEALERDVPRLSNDDRTRALRPSDARERRHRLAAYMGLRVVLERVAGGEVRGQRFVRGPSGKPRLGAGGPAFSLSHTAGLALIGVAHAGTIGVDLERARPLEMSRRRREEILAVAAGLASEPAGDPMNDEALLGAWCRLEAFAKARGEGLSHLLGELGLRKAAGRQLAHGQIAEAARHLLSPHRRRDRRRQAPARPLRCGGGGRPSPNPSAAPLSCRSCSHSPNSSRPRLTAMPQPGK